MNDAATELGLLQRAAAGDPVVRAVYADWLEEHGRGEESRAWRKLERIVSFSPAFDRRHSDPHKNYGIHGVELRMAVRGPRGALSFTLFTDWQLPHVREELGRQVSPTPAGLDWHSPVPRYEGQEVCRESCAWLDGAPCYSDGSALRADDVYRVLLEKGDEGVWEFLEREYRKVFEGPPKEA